MEQVTIEEITNKEEDFNFENEISKISKHKIKTIYGNIYSNLTYLFFIKKQNNKISHIETGTNCKEVFINKFKATIKKPGEFVYLFAVNPLVSNYEKKLDQIIDYVKIHESDLGFNSKFYKFKFEDISILGIEPENTWTMNPMALSLFGLLLRIGFFNEILNNEKALLKVQDKLSSSGYDFITCNFTDSDFNKVIKITDDKNISFYMEDYDEFITDDRLLWMINDRQIAKSSTLLKLMKTKNLHKAFKAKSSSWRQRLNQEHGCVEGSQSLKLYERKKVKDLNEETIGFFKEKELTKILGL